MELDCSKRVATSRADSFDCLTPLSLPSLPRRHGERRAIQSFLRVFLLSVEFWNLLPQPRRRESRAIEVGCNDLLWAPKEVDSDTKQFKLAASRHLLQGIPFAQKKAALRVLDEQGAVGGDATCGLTGAVWLVARQNYTINVLLVELRRRPS